MRALAVAVLALLLAACAGPDSTAPGAAKIDVGAHDLVAYKAKTDIPTCAPGQGDAVDGGLPDVTLPCLGGGPSVDLASLRGPMLVNLWASWCAPCRKEMPALEAVHRQYGDKLTVLGIDYTDAQPGAALQLAVASKVTYPLLADPQSALLGKDPFGARIGLPVTALVDADGKVVHVEAGSQTKAGFAALVREHLGLS